MISLNKDEKMIRVYIKEIVNNKEKYFKISKNNSIPDLQYQYENIDNFIVDQQYYCKNNFKRISFKKNKISNVYFRFNIFYKCDFKDLIFINSFFEGCYFIECNMENIEFQQFRWDDLQNGSVVFQNCEIIDIKFVDCLIRNPIFINCITALEFCNSNLIEAYFCDSYNYKFILVNTKISWLRFINPNFYIIKIEPQKLLISSTDEIFIGEFNYKKTYKYIQMKATGKSDDLIEFLYGPKKNMSKAYRIFAQVYFNNNYPEFFGEYYYLSKKTELDYLKGFEKLKAIVALFTCGFGERPINSLITSFAVIVLSSFLYMIIGLEGIEPIKSISITALAKQFFYYFHFSLVTFATVGYGNVTPKGWGLVISALEILFGVIMIAIWTSTIVRKMTR